MRETVKQLMENGFTEIDLLNAAEADCVELWYRLEGLKKEILRNHLLERIAFNPFHFYPCYFRDYPYQEEISDTRTITLFPSPEETARFIEQVEEGREPFLNVGMLGIHENAQFLVPIIQQLLYLGVNQVRMLGGEALDIEFVCPMSELKNKLTATVVSSAVNTRRYMGRMEEALARDMGNETVTDYQTEAFYQASQERFLVPMKGEIPIVNDDSFPIYTDIIELWKYADLEEHQYDRIEAMSWHEIASYSCRVILNKFLDINHEMVRNINRYTIQGDMAVYYIRSSYGLQPGIDADDEKVGEIYDDIEAAPPVQAELFHLMKEVPSSEDSSITVVDCDFGNEALVAIEGVTAKMLVDSGFCQNPMKAYHVLSLLYNDPDGKNKKQFENAELFE